MCVRAAYRCSRARPPPPSLGEGGLRQPAEGFDRRLRCCGCVFFTRPYERFTIDKAGDVETAVLLLVVGLVVSQLAALDTAETTRE
jgi:hypothetical protein